MERDSPAVQLFDLGEAAMVAQAAAHELERLACSARFAGASWREIALVCGCSVQSAVGRWGRIGKRPGQCAGQARLFSTERG